MQCQQEHACCMSVHIPMAGQCLFSRPALLCLEGLPLLPQLICAFQLCSDTQTGCQAFSTIYIIHISLLWITEDFICLIKPGEGFLSFVSQMIIKMFIWVKNLLN
jgi:hypothetical protein